MLLWHCLARVNSQSHDDDVSDDLWRCWQEAAFLAWKSLQHSDLLSNDSDTVTSHRCFAQLIYMYPRWASDTGLGGTRGAASTPMLYQLLTPVNGYTAQTNHQDMQQQMGGAHPTPALQSHQNILSTNIWLCYGGIIWNQLCTNDNCWSKHRHTCLLNKACGVGDHSQMFNIIQLSEAFDHISWSVSLDRVCSLVMEINYIYTYIHTHIHIFKDCQLKALEKALRRGTFLLDKKKKKKIMITVILSCNCASVRIPENMCLWIYAKKGGIGNW